MKEGIVELTEDVSASPLYSEDLAPVPKEKRTWNKWSLAALWVGMAVCIPTYLLASYMMADGMGWLESLIIIGVANIIITIPMVLNGHAGVKYGVPFPVVGRSSFGVNGIHLASITRAIVACGWFGIQTWIGGMALYEIFYAFSDNPTPTDLNLLMFVCFGAFWFLNMFFIWKGTNSIKWLEEYSAPILILMGVVLIGWGAYNGGGFSNVLKQSEQLQNPVFSKIDNLDNSITIHPIVDAKGYPKANLYQSQIISISDTTVSPWKELSKNGIIPLPDNYNKADQLSFRLRSDKKEKKHLSSWVNVDLKAPKKEAPNKGWQYLKWLTVMLGFWATMSLSIADITRYAPTQKSQKQGQFIGLPGTMMLYSFVAIFVTCAALINFDDVLIAGDAPWDPTTLLGKFESPWVVVVAQFFMIIATLSTNIAANVIAPSNAFSNLFPKKISFKKGGTITGIIGILICPWWLMSYIAPLMLFIGGLLGAVLAIMLCDYFVIRKKELKLVDLYKRDGIYSYGKTGFNKAAIIALCLGVIAALVWEMIPSLAYLNNLAWFSGFFVSFTAYYILMKNSNHYKNLNNN
ncbi:MAG: cytosine/uracil/thiamine/allantoin permease [Glaciecola sp.]|jgi:cytosine/uracil/thiamine/allantoin permease